MGSFPDDNWVAACQLCNAYKSDLRFADLDDVRQHIIERARAHRHDPMPLWTPDRDETDLQRRRRETAEDRERRQSEPGYIASSVDEWLAEHGGTMAQRARENVVERRRRRGTPDPGPDPVDEWLAEHGERE